MPIFESLAQVTDVVLVVTQPDRKGGRGCKMCKPPVKEAAETHGIEVIQPAVVKGRRFANKMAEYAPDFIVTAAFGRILGPSLLAVPTQKALNVHASLLPKYRGAAPANWAIINGDGITGICVMEMVPKLDAGPVYYCKEIEIDENETAGELLSRLSLLGAESIAECIKTFGNLSPVPQNEADASYARVLTKADGLIDWRKSAAEIVNHIRGMSPWPSAFSCIAGEPYKIHRAKPLEQENADAPPGTIVSTSKSGLDVACGQGILRVTEIQAPGRKRMPIQTFLVGTPLTSGTRLCRS